MTDGDILLDGLVDRFLFVADSDVGQLVDERVNECVWIDFDQGNNFRIEDGQRLGLLFCLIMWDGMKAIQVPRCDPDCQSLKLWRLGIDGRRR